MEAIGGIVIAFITLTGVLFTAIFSYQTMKKVQESTKEIAQMKINSENIKTLLDHAINTRNFTANVLLGRNDTLKGCAVKILDDLKSAQEKTYRTKLFKIISANPNSTLREQETEKMRQEMTHIIDKVNTEIISILPTEGNFSKDEVHALTGRYITAVNFVKMHIDMSSNIAFFNQLDTNIRVGNTEKQSILAMEEASNKLIEMVNKIFEYYSSRERTLNDQIMNANEESRITNLLENK